MYQLLLRGLP